MGTNRACRMLDIYRMLGMAQVVWDMVCMYLLKCSRTYYFSLRLISSLHHFWDFGVMLCIIHFSSPKIMASSNSESTALRSIGSKYTCSNSWMTQGMSPSLALSIQMSIGPLSDHSDFAWTDGSSTALCIRERRARRRRCIIRPRFESIAVILR